jgi:hypothetical protein
MKTKQSILHYVAGSLVAAAMISVTTPASARDQVPFRGVVSGSVISITPLDECHQLTEAVNDGNATQPRFRRSEALMFRNFASEIIAGNLTKAGFSMGCVSVIDSNGRTIWIADAHQGDGKQYIVRGYELLTAFRELEHAVHQR